jgi:ligand-binding sensor domain-containing protein/DNA-binding CsgD family transcriptional regulator
MTVLPHRCRIFFGCLLALLAGAKPPLSASPLEQIFQAISIEDGLSQNTISCILQDRKRFMWFGSEEGLNRFDGYSFKVFRHLRGHENGLSHDRIACLLEDGDGAFWIGTLGGGLDRFEPDTERFSHHRHEAGNETSLSHDSVRALLHDGQGRLWVGTDGGLDLFDPRTNRVQRIPFSGDAGVSGAPLAVLSLLRDRTGVLWVGTEHGLFRYDASGGRCLSMNGASPGSNPAPAGRDQINSIFEDESGGIWLGTEAGLASLDRDLGRFQFKVGGAGVLPHLYRSRIMEIIGDHRGGVWIGCETGIYYFPVAGQLAVYFKAGAVPRRMLRDHFIISLFQDAEGILWAGTFSGIFKYDLRTRQFALCGPELNETDREKEDFRLPVSAVCQDGRQWLWLGTYKKGLLAINRGTNEKKSFSALPGHLRPLKDMIVQALFVDRGQTLWIGTQNGLHSYDIPGDRFIGYYHGARNGGGLSHDSVTAIFQDRAGRLWVGTEDGLNLFDPLRRSFVSFHGDPAAAPLIGRDRISALIEDAAGSFWVGTYGGGLSRFDPETGRFTDLYRSQPRGPASIGSDKIYCLLEDSHKNFWIGTNSGGLSLFDRGNGTFTNFSSEDGLPNNTILAMLEDSRGYLWLSTNRGLCRFDPQRRTFRSFTARDGLQANEFLPKVAFKGADQELFFGGPNGLTCFFAENIVDNTYVPPVWITQVDTFRGNREPLADPGRLNRLELGHRDRIVSFTFAALSYADSRRNRYAYKIEGLHDEWIHIGNRHEVTVSNLRPGRYVFRVKGANNHGVWNEQGAALAISMRPPWWQTVWFRVPASLLLLLAVIFWYRSRTRRLAARIRTEAAMDQYLDRHDVSQREKEIVLLLLKGKSNKEIEDTLFIAMGTVKNHIYSIYQKMGVKNRAQLITLFKNLQVK